MGTEYGGNLRLGISWRSEQLSSSTDCCVFKGRCRRMYKSNAILAIAAGSLAWGPFIATTRSAIWRGGSLGHPR